MRFVLGRARRGSGSARLVREEFFVVAAIFLRAVEFVRNRQRREHRNFLRVDRRSRASAIACIFSSTYCRQVWTYASSSSPRIAYVCPNI